MAIKANPFGLPVKPLKRPFKYTLSNGKNTNIKFTIKYNTKTNTSNSDALLLFFKYNKLINLKITNPTSQNPRDRNPAAIPIGENNNVIKNAIMVNGSK